MAKTKVHGEYIADDAIDSQHYADGSIDTAHIADDQVTQAKMANDSVGADELASSAVVTASIVDDAVTSAKLDTNIDIAGTLDVTGATTLDSTLTVKGATVFNEDSADVDFRVESNGNANAIFVNGGDDRVTFFNGTTVNAASGTNDGVSHYSDGRTDISRASAQPLNLRRRTDDGVIVNFYKEASGSVTNVGSIGTVSGQPYFTGATAGGFQISHLNSTNAVIVPVTAAGANSDATHDIGYTGKRFRNIVLSGDVTAAKIISPSNLHFNQNGNSADRSINFTGTTFKPFDSSDNTLDLGTSGARWKDLYLSGGAYVGGTAAANKLDDYEEGTWTPAVMSGASNLTLSSYAAQQGHYTKVGRLVHVIMTLGFVVNDNGTGPITITGLPYTTKNDSGARITGHVDLYNYNSPSSIIQIGVEGVSNATSLNLLGSRDDSTWYNLQAQELVDGGTYYIKFTGSYIT